MSFIFRSVLTTALLVPLAGCKEDPPPPPPIGATSGAPAGSSGTPRKAEPQKPVKLDDETIAVLKLGSCYWGTMAIAMTRDAYLESTKDGDPSAEKLPSFGDFPEYQKQAEARKAAGREEIPVTHHNLPYLRHLRACQNAKASPAKLEGVTDALASYDTYITQLSEVFTKANKYYARDGFKQDEFKAGKEMHATLKQLLPQLDEKRAPLTTAYLAWFDMHKDWMPKDELTPSGKAATVAVLKGEEVAVMLIAEKRDKAALEAAIAAFKAAGTALEETAKAEPEKRSPHHASLAPHIAEFARTATELAAVDGKLTVAQLYTPMSLLATMFEAHVRAIEQVARLKGRGPMKVLNPADARSPVEGGRPLRTLKRPGEGEEQQ